MSARRSIPDADGLRASIAEALSKNTHGADAMFRRLVFGRDTGPFVVSEKLALVMRDGFDPPGGTDPIPLALAAVCFEFGRLDLLKEVLNAKHPSVVADRDVSADSSWLRHLCTRKFAGCYNRTPITSFATFDIRPYSVDFVVLALEVDPEDWSSEVVRQGEAGAVVSAARMQLRIKAELSSPEEKAPAAAPAPRRIRAL